MFLFAFQTTPSTAVGKPLDQIPPDNDHHFISSRLSPNSGTSFIRIPLSGYLLNVEFGRKNGDQLDVRTE